MRIAIIGGGVAGTTTAWFLQHHHDVCLFDRESHLGGHVLTCDVATPSRPVHAEIGPRFFFDGAHPHFLALLRLLGVRLDWCEARLAFSSRARGDTLVLPPSSPKHALAYLRSPTTLGHALCLYRLCRAIQPIARGGDWSLTLRAYLQQNGYPESFGPGFIYPFLAACWGAPLADIERFPVYTLLKGLPSSPDQRLGTYEIEGGMSAYMRAFARQLTQVDLRLATGVTRIQHDGSAFRVRDEHGHEETFDRVVVATSSRDAVELLSEIDPAKEMVSTLRGFRHFEVEIVVHGDASFMPRDREDWALVNLFDEGDHAWMTDWSGWRYDLPVFRTWMPRGRALPTPLYQRRRFHHLLMTPENVILQRRIAALQGRAGIWIAGMYSVDIDNHESALFSAIPVARALAPESPNLQRLLAEAANVATPIIPGVPAAAVRAGT